MIIGYEWHPHFHLVEDMDRLDAMYVLVTAVEAGSLSAASRQLGIPLTTVSRKVSDLEAHLGARLLNRSRRQLSLTEAGRSYVQACMRILDDVREAERVASGEYGAPRGELAITAPLVFGRLHVLPLVSAFLQTYREIDVRMLLADRVVNLLEEKVDIAVRIGELPDSSLVAARVGQIRRVVCASPAYFAARGQPQTPDELIRHDCITFEGLMSSSSWVFATKRDALAVRIHSRLVVNTAETAIDAAIAGVGVTRVLSYQVAEALKSGTLVTALEEYEPPASSVHLVFSGAPYLPQKVRAFVDFTAPRLKQRLLDAN